VSEDRELHGLPCRYVLVSDVPVRYRCDGVLFLTDVRQFDDGSYQFVFECDRCRGVFGWYVPDNRLLVWNSEVVV